MRISQWERLSTGAGRLNYRMEWQGFPAPVLKRQAILIKAIS